MLRLPHTVGWCGGSSYSQGLGVRFGPRRGQEPTWINGLAGDLAERSSAVHGKPLSGHTSLLD